MILRIAVLAAALVLALGFPHAHLANGSFRKGDCVLCHAQKAPAIEARSADSIPELAVESRIDERHDGEERDAALRLHRSRAPPA